MINRSSTINNYAYNPDRTLDYFNQPAPHYKKDYNAFYGELGDKNYGELLEDYKESVIRDYHKYEDDVVKTAVAWNCSEFLMKKKLSKWGVIKMYGKSNIIITDDEIIEIYNQTHNILKMSKKLKISHYYIREILKKYNIDIIHHTNTNYNELIKDKNKLLEMVEYYKNNGEIETANKYNFSTFLVKKVLKKFDMLGYYKKNKKNKGLIFGKKAIWEQKDFFYDS